MKLRKSHALQRQVRQKMSDLEAGRRKGNVPPDKYKEEVATLEARRSDLTRQVNELLAKEDALKKELGGAQA